MKYVLLALALLFGSAQAATISWTPTDGDINAFSLEFDIDPGLPNADLAGYYLFAGDDADFSGWALPVSNLRDVGTVTVLGTVVPGSDNVRVYEEPAGWFLENSTGDVVFANGDPAFQLAVFDGTDFHGADAIEPAGQNTWGLGFEPHAELSATALLVDVEPTAVPLPGAVWLFGSGLLGFALVSRRKREGWQPS